GWEPIVLTVKEHYHALTDSSRLKDLGQVPYVYRTRMVPQLGRFYLALKTLHRNATPGPAARAAVAPSSNNNRDVLSSIRRSLLSLECLPDDKQTWIPLAVPIAAKIVRQHNVDALLTTGPPMSCHVIGLLLKAITRRRWIADFRDPWVLNREESVSPSTAFSRAAQAWLEWKTMRNADSVVFTTDRMRAYLQQRYPFITTKSAVILNGYDPSDFNGGRIDACRSDRTTFTLTHTGTIYQKRSAESLLRCLSELVHAGKI